MATETGLRQRIMAKIAYHRRMIEEYSDVLGEAGGAEVPTAEEVAVAPSGGSVPSSAVASTPVSGAVAVLHPEHAESHEPGKTRRGRARRRRKAGLLDNYIRDILGQEPGLTVGDIARRIETRFGDRVKTGQINTYLTKAAAEGHFTKDTTGGPRRTRWSLAGAPAPVEEAPAEEPRRGRRKG